jgi:hypothetical protein
MNVISFHAGGGYGLKHHSVLQPMKIENGNEEDGRMWECPP